MLIDVILLYIFQDYEISVNAQGPYYGLKEIIKLELQHWNQNKIHSRNWCRGDFVHLYKIFMCFLILDCWHQEPHFRPTFYDIIRSLEEVKSSSFMTTPQDSFHSLQEDWRLEIEEMFDELRIREKVTVFSCDSILMLCQILCWTFWVFKLSCWVQITTK